MTEIDFDWTDAGDAEDHACKLEAVAKKLLAIWGHVDANDLHIAAQCIRGLANDVERLSSMASRLDTQQNDKHHGPHCAGQCEGAAYQIEIRRLQAENANLKAENEALREALESILEADLRGQGAGYAEAMKRGVRALAAHDQGGAR